MLLERLDVEEPRPTAKPLGRGVDSSSAAGMDLRRLMAAVGAAYWLLMTVLVVPAGVVCSLFGVLYPLMGVAWAFGLGLSFVNRVEHLLCRMVNEHWVAAGQYTGLNVSEYGDDLAEVADRRLLVLANHLGLTDHFVLMTAFHDKRSLPGAYLWIIFNIWKWTPLGAMWMSHGNFFINGGAARRQAVLKDLRLHLRANYHKHEHGAVVLYPEGSRLFLVRESERRFAAKNGLAPFQHCVHPRSGAAHAVLLECGPSLQDATRTVHGRPPMEFVVDCTLGYPRGEVVDLGAAMVGEWPRGDTHVAVHYAVHPVRPEWQDEGKLKDWLYARYAEKDRLLAEFYRTGRFPGKPRPVVFPLARSLLAELFWALVFYAHWSAWMRPLGALLGRQLWALVA